MWNLHKSQHLVYLLLTRSPKSSEKLVSKITRLSRYDRGAAIEATAAAEAVPVAAGAVVATVLGATAATKAVAMAA
jgi:hypothetical protein